MTVASAASGTQTATIGTEHTLATLTTGKTFQLLVDTINLSTLDTVELRVKMKVLTGGVSRVAYYEQFSGAQSIDDIIKISMPAAALFEAVFTLKQTAGTGRAFDWNVLSLD